MSPVTHYLVSWLAANSSTRLDRRERITITAAGIISDLDGIGIIAEYLTSQSGHPLLWWSEYHHVLGHNLVFGIIFSLIAAFWATQRLLTFGLACLSFHLHLLGDLMGSRGPDGYQWPVAYLFPFSEAWKLSWDGQWALNAWPNFLITAGAVLCVCLLTHRRGYSPMEMISLKLDKAFVNVLRQRF